MTPEQKHDLVVQVVDSALKVSNGCQALAKNAGASPAEKRMWAAVAKQALSLFDLLLAATKETE